MTTMTKSNRKDLLFLNLAASVSAFSHCNRRKVGAVIVDKDNRVISTGYNGTPKGTCNDCEDAAGKTKPTVIHAERNAIAFAQQNLQGCTIYITLSPCITCAAEIIQAGIERVVFSEHYHRHINDQSICGATYLKSEGVLVEHLKNH